MKIENITTAIHPANQALADESLGNIEGVGPFQKNIGATVDIQLGTFLSSLITTFTVVAGLAFIIYFIMAAFKWITSSGDKNKTEEAKTQMTQAVLGLIVVVAGYFIVALIGGVLGLDILNPGKLLKLQDTIPPVAPS